MHSNYFNDEIVLPLYKVSPEEIFSGQVPLLDANFFKDTSGEEVSADDSNGIPIKNILKDSGTWNLDLLTPDWSYNIGDEDIIRENINEFFANNNVSVSIGEDEFEDNYMYTYNYSTDSGNMEEYPLTQWEEDGKTYSASIYQVFNYDELSGTLDSVDYGCVIYEYSYTPITSIGQGLRSTIAKWYYTLRNFAIVAMMIILVYIGIRILLCSTAKDKARYKNMLVDWVVALCLMFIMHYIMVFATNIADSLIDLFASVEGEKTYEFVIQDENGIINKLKDNKTLTDNGINVEDIVYTEGSTKYLMWDAKNMMGMVRCLASANSSEAGYLYIGYVIAFLVLVCYTVFFLFTYIKRVLYLAFFTIISPLVAMTYPLDKIHDGKAQAFNMWIKEYIVNLLIQPVHLLLYTVLISSAFEFASTNVIYMLVAIGFLTPAEKFIKKMFGLNVAETPGLLGGAVGAGVLMSGLNRLMRPKPATKGSSSSKGDTKKGEEVIPNDTSNNSLKNLRGNTAEKGGSGGSVALTTGARMAGSANIPGRSRSNSRLAVGARRSRTTRKASDKYRKNVKLTPISAPKPKPANPVRKEISTQKKDTKLARFGRGLKLAGKDYLGQKFTRIAEKNANGDYIRSISRIGKGAIAGAGLGLAGLTIGIASGDISKVGSYTAGAAAGGYALGSRDVNSDTDMDSIKEQYELGYYGSPEEYKQAKLEERREDYCNDIDNIRAVQKNLNLSSEGEAKELLETYSSCIDAGITDPKDVSTVIALQKDKGWSAGKAITAAKYYKSAGGKKPSKMSPKEREAIEAIFGRSLSDIEDEEAKQHQIKMMTQVLEDYGKRKDEIDQI